MMARRMGRLFVVAGLLLACDRDAASTPPDDTPAPSPRSDASELAPDSVVEADDGEEIEAIDTSFRVDGGLSKPQIQAVIDDRFTPIRECFEGALDRIDQIDPGQPVVVRWVIGTGGDVTDAEVEASRFGDRDTERCIVEAIRAWSFPTLKRKPTTVHYAFYLRSY